MAIAVHVTSVYGCVAVNPLYATGAKAFKSSN